MAQAITPMQVTVPRQSPMAMGNGGWKPYDGAAAYPGYIPGYDPGTMSMTDYLLKNYNPAGLDAFRQQALRKGPSPWAMMSKNDLRAQEANQREKMTREANADTSSSMEKLASSGGLSSGARERAATEGAKNEMAMSQDLARQGNLNALQVGINDEQNRIQQLSMLPGMEQSQAGMYEQAKGQDVANQLAENERRNAYNMNLYNTQMQTWAANRQAQATENSAKRGLFK